MDHAWSVRFHATKEHACLWCIYMVYAWKQSFLDMIEQSAQSLLRIINDILDFSKAEAGKLEVNITELDAIKLIKNSMRLVIPRAEQAQGRTKRRLTTQSTKHALTAHS